MTVTTAAPSTKYRRWPIFVMPVLVVIAAAAWSAFWFYAASQVDRTVDVWRAREAASGRTFDCAKRTLTGFPFRLEVNCEDATVELKSQTADQAAALTARLGDIFVISQIYTPKLLIAAFKCPATLSQHGQPVMVVNWKTARSSIVGLPGLRRVRISYSTIRRSTASRPRGRPRLRAPAMWSFTAALRRTPDRITRRSRPSSN